MSTNEQCIRIYRALSRHSRPTKIKLYFKGGEGGVKEGTGSADLHNFSAKLNLPVQIFLKSNLNTQRVRQKMNKTRAFQ